MVSHAQPHRPEHAHADTIFIVTILLSLALHAAAFGLLPNFFKAPAKLAEQLTVEFLPPPPPKPVPPPEPPKPEPEKPKPLPKKVVPPPKPLPAIQPRAETPPPARVAEPPPPQVIAAAPKASEPTPAVTVPSPPPAPVVEPQPKSVTPPPDLDAVRSNYGSVLSREFAKHKQYPRIAQMRGWQGTSRIELQIDATGTVTAVNIAESSGFDILDKQAIESVRKALPLPPIPEELRGKEFTIVVPMKFSLQ